MDLKAIKQLIKENNLVKFYQHRSWRALRYSALVRDNFECQECKRNGRVTTTPHVAPRVTRHAPARSPSGYKKGQRHSSLEVHHLKEVKDFPELALVLSNLETLCISCHNKVHDRLDNFKKSNNKFFSPERW